MFKTANNNTKTFTQQRAVLKPMKNVAIFEEEDQDFEEEEEDDIYLEDGSSSCHSNGLAVTTHDSRNETMLLARFFSTTGPEEYAFNNSNNKENQNKKQQQFNRASKLLNKLRKRPTMPVLRSPPTAGAGFTGGMMNGAGTILGESTKMIKKNYIPLPVYEEPSFSNNMNLTTTTPITNYNKSAPTTSITAAAAAQQTANVANAANANASNNKTTSTTPPTTILKSSTAVATQTTPPSALKKNPHQQQAPLSPIQQQLRDSGIYSETASEKDSSVLSTNTTITQHLISSRPPLPPFLNDLQQFPQPPYHNITTATKNPRRPAPLPPAIASAAIAIACSPKANTVRSVPEAALKRRSVRLRHVQVQTELLSGSSTNNSKSSDANKTQKDDLVVVVPSSSTSTNQQQQQQQEDRQACPHCRQVISGATNNRIRRPSCPPALSSGPFIPKALSKQEEEEEEYEDNEEGRTDAKALLAMIMKLKSQLAEEKQCRIKLEKAMYQRQSDEEREHLAKEKDRWAGDCLWLNDRIALLPE